MCGIVGTVRIGDRALVERMAGLLVHRGPDDAGYWEHGDVRLGHRRLSILDLSAAGHQPMVSHSGRTVITYNGEIYNFPELRAELEQLGHRFDTGTDTETLLAAYEQFGVAFLERIEGIFAFGMWDERERTLLLARDRSGIKPLYYHVAGDGLAFASELKALRLLPGFRSRVNRNALRSALRYASNIEDETMLAGVHKVRPGEYLLWRDGRVERRTYYEYPAPRARDWDEDDLARELRDRLGRVVRSQMISDAPLGAALSGGLDSSGIVALMAGSGAAVDTFTVGHGADDPDLVNARIVAEHCKVRHHEIYIGSGDVAELLPRVMWFLEEPLGQMESLQMYLNYREASRHVKVLLIGEGADELFAGYDRYRLFDRRLPLPMGLRRELYDRVYMYADAQPRSLAGSVLSRGMWGSLPPSPLRDPTPRAAGPQLDGAGPGRALEIALNHDQRTYLHHLSLKRADATGMAHSVELRVPFLGREIVELAAEIPARLLMKGGVEKYILRRALAPLLPASIVERRKRPFQMTLDRGLADALDVLCERLLKPADVAARGFFAPELVAALRHGRPRKGRAGIAHKVWSYRVWAMLMCEVWARLFVDRDPAAPAPAGLGDIA